MCFSAFYLFHIFIVGDDDGKKGFNTSLFIQIEQVCKASALNKLNEKKYIVCVLQNISTTIKAISWRKFFFFIFFAFAITTINHIYRSNYCFTTLLTPFDSPVASPDNLSIFNVFLIFATYVFFVTLLSRF